MCESTVFLKKGERRELLMEDVVRIAVDNEQIQLTGILGETRKAKGRIKEIDLMAHTILIAE